MHTCYYSSTRLAAGCMVGPASTATSGLSPSSLCASSGCVDRGVPELYGFNPHSLVHPHADIALWLPVWWQNAQESKQRRTTIFSTLISFDQPCVVNALYSSAAVWLVPPAVLLKILSVWEYYTSVAITALYNYIRVCNLHMLLLKQVLKASEKSYQKLWTTDTGLFAIYFIHWLGKEVKSSLG